MEFHGNPLYIDLLPIRLQEYLQISSCALFSYRSAPGEFSNLITEQVHDFVVIFFSSTHRILPRVQAVLIAMIIQILHDPPGAEFRYAIPGSDFAGPDMAASFTYGRLESYDIKGKNALRYRIILLAGMIIMAMERIQMRNDLLKKMDHVIPSSLTSHCHNRWHIYLFVSRIPLRKRSAMSALAELEHNHRHNRRYRNPRLSPGGQESSGHLPGAPRYP